MSSQIPGGPVEYLGPEESEPAKRGSGRRTALIAGAAVGVLAFAGVGAWGMTQFLGGGGPGAATAVPADALAYVSLDLDPAAGQKVEAYRTLRKFPALEKHLGSGEDLRRSIVESILADAPCEGLTFDDDFDPWLGDRVGLALVPGGSGDSAPQPVAALQVKDEDKARAGIRTLAECGGSADDAPGMAFTGDYMVLAEDDDTAERVARDAEGDSLADDEDFNHWVDEAGGGGIVTAYLSPDSPAALSGLLGPGPLGPMTGLDGAMSATSAGAALTSSNVDPASDGGPGGLGKAFEDFEGAAVVARFDDGALEVESATSPLADISTSEGRSGLGDLPDTTAAGLGVGVADDFVDHLLDGLRASMGEDRVDSGLQLLEAQTGLTADDLQAVLGDGFSVALDSSVDWSALFSATGDDVPEVPAGLRIVGDPGEVRPALEKVLSALDLDAQVVVQSGDDAVAVGPDEGYVATLAQDGALGDEDSFRSALPDLDDSQTGAFVDFDAGDWLTRLVDEQSSDDATRANVEPLSSLGVSGTTDGDVVHGLLRLTTD